MKRLMNFVALAVVGLAMMAGASARADGITITLDNPNQTGNPGQLIEFFGTVTNNSTDTDPADSIYLNSDYLTLALTDATQNDNFYAAYYPIALAGGESSGDIDLFDYTLANPETDLFGPHAGIYQLLGGIDGGAQTASDSLDEVNFSVDVEPAPSGTPEPGTCYLLGGGLALLGLRFGAPLQSAPEPGATKYPKTTGGNHKRFTLQNQ